MLEWFIVVLACVIAGSAGWKRGRLDVSLIDKKLIVHVFVFIGILCALVFGAFAMRGSAQVGWITVIACFFGMVFAFGALVVGLPAKRRG